MDSMVIDALEQRIDRLLADYLQLKSANEALREENQRLLAERGQVKARIDMLLARLENV
jgi:FtsZ-binding cell division protein ZapB